MSPTSARAKTFSVQDEVRELALTIICGTCRADIGDPCTDSLGRDLPSRVHPDRIVPIFVAFRAGERHGRRTMKEELERGRAAVDS